MKDEENRKKTERNGSHDETICSSMKRNEMKLSL